MTLDELSQSAEVWGADIGRWPRHLRAAAEALAETPAAAAVLRDAGMLDRLIVEAKPWPSDDRIERAMAKVAAVIAECEDRITRRRMPALQPWLVPAACMIGAAILGISLGLLTPLTSASRPALLAMILDARSFDPDWVLR